MTRLVLTVAGVAAAGVGLWAADRASYDAFRARAARIRAAAVDDREPVTEEDLRDVPEPLARHLRFSGAVGQKRITAVHVRHSGRFKPGAGQPWMRIRGEYFITTKPPSFTWHGKIGAVGINVVAVDSYADGRGRMQVKLLSLLPIVDTQSEQVSQSAFGRCIAELTMAPTFFLNRDRVRCTELGPDQVRCRVTDGRFSTDADLYINPDGSLDRVVVMRHFDRGGGKTTLERFTGKASRPSAFGGRRLASRFDGIWNVPEGDLHYVSFDVDSVEWE
jgi:hypothetical protein